MVGIYKITNPKGKIYIGKSKNIEGRFSSYNKMQHCHQQRKLYNSLKKYGPEKHEFSIIEECRFEELNKKEIHHILTLKSAINGLNLTLGGDGGELSKESEELRRVNSMKSILQYSLNGDFIKEYKGASDAIKQFNKGTSNNINDCARGKYKSTYGYQWLYKKGTIKQKNPCYITKKRGLEWTVERRIKTHNSREGEKRSQEYKDKIRKIKTKAIYQYNINEELINIYPSFMSFEGSGVLGTTKLRKIINKSIFYKGFRYTNIKK